MILRFEVNDVADVRRAGTLSFLRITETRSCGPDGLALAYQPVPVQRRTPNCLIQQSRAVVTLPQPVIERSQSCACEYIGRRGTRRCTRGLTRRLGFDVWRSTLKAVAAARCGGVRKTCAHKGASESRKQQFTRRIGFDVGRDARPGVGPLACGGAKFAG